MPWAFRFNGGIESPLDLLPWRELQALAKKYPEMSRSWIDWKDNPVAIAALDLEAFTELRALAARHVGVDVEPFGDSAKDAERAMLEVVQVEDDLPDEWRDGAPTEGSQATT